jgi:hypothetical protein
MSVAQMEWSLLIDAIDTSINWSYTLQEGGYILFLNDICIRKISLLDMQLR